MGDVLHSHSLRWHRLDSDPCPRPRVNRSLKIPEGPRRDVTISILVTYFQETNTQPGSARICWLPSALMPSMLATARAVRLQRLEGAQEITK